MTDYRETRQDREDAERLAIIDGRLDALYSVRQTLADAGLETSRTYRQTEEDVRDLTARRTRIVAEGEARLQAFYSDRAKVKRALAALRREGFAASMSEPAYESTSEGSFAIAEAQQAGTPHVFTRRNQVAYAFEVEGPRWSRTPEQGDTLTHVLYLSWGPCDTAEDVARYGSAIVAAFEAEGLRTSWTGSGADCVQVLGEGVEADR